MRCSICDFESQGLSDYLSDYGSSHSFFKHSSGPVCSECFLSIKSVEAQYPHRYEEGDSPFVDDEEYEGDEDVGDFVEDYIA